MRLFFAVPVIETVKELIAREIERFPVNDPPWRWIPPENLHLTLKFLGDVEEQLVPSLAQAAERTVAGIPGFRISFGRFGAFPSLRGPRVIFYGIEEGFESLASLASVLEKETERIGFAREKRAFRAHLTLARIKRPLPSAITGKLETVPCLPPGAGQTVDRVVLMKSTLYRTGAVYGEIRSFALAGSS